MGTTVVIEFQAKPGQRATLRNALETISATYGPTVAGYLGSTLHETIDSPDGLVEIARWESAEAQAAGVEEAMKSGIYAPLFDMVAAPFRVTRVTP